LTISVYLREHTSNYSSIKVGSYDPSGVEPGSSLVLFRTVSPREWSLTVNNFQINNGQLLGANRVLALVYHLPYLYLPDIEFANFAYEIRQWDASIECDNYICKYKGVACHDLHVDKSKFFRFKFRLWDTTGKGLDVQIPVSHGFYINNTALNSSQVFCALPVIRSNDTKQQNVWYFGSVYLSYFYTVLDQSPMFEHGKDYI